MLFFLSAIQKPQSEIGSAWQLVFVSFAAVVILFEVLRGWRLGLARQIMRLIAIIAAYASAIFGGPAVVPIARSVLKLADPLLALFGGAVLALLTYTIISNLGIVLFKRTSQQESMAFRLLYGFTGAVFGILFGAFFVWLVFAGVRLIGSIAEAQVRAHQALTSATMQPVWNRPLRVENEPAPPPASPSPLIATLAQMKSSLESGPIGNSLRTADPIPATTYTTLEKLGEVSSKPEAAQRFLTFPGAREIGEHPKVIALRNDPKVLDLVAQGRIFELLHNQHLIDAMNDPTLSARIKKFDLDRALDYALKP
jgi:hypothetical protein